MEVGEVAIWSQTLVRGRRAEDLQEGDQVANPALAVIRAASETAMRWHDLACRAEEWDPARAKALTDAARRLEAAILAADPAEVALVAATEGAALARGSLYPRGDGMGGAKT